MASRKKRRTYHHGDLRRALVAEALVLVSEVGAEGLTLKELARRIGVSHPAMYRHFSSRAALFEAIAAAGHEMLHAKIAAALAAAPKDPRERFLAGSWAYVSFALDHPGHFRVMFNAPKKEPPSKELLDVATGAFNLLLDFIREAQASGVIGPGDPRAIAMPIWAMHHGLASLAASGRLSVPGRAAMKRLSDDVHLALLDGLARGLSSPPRVRPAPRSRET